MAHIDISIIIPIYNGEKWINSCMKSIAAQTIFNSEHRLEIVVFNDGSNDKTETLLQDWAFYFQKRHINFVQTGSIISKGVGAAKNGAIKKSRGQYLCFQDIDDVMHEDRIMLQWRAAKLNHKALVGSRILRNPENSTPRLVKWANHISKTKLKLQIYTSNGPTLLMPTWFCHKSVYNKVGSFNEFGSGTPEDLIFFYAHLDAGGDLYRVDEYLIIYTYHEGATSFSIKREDIRKVQICRLQKEILNNWSTFTVWNAGKAGRRFVRSLNKTTRGKVKEFCDIDTNKIGQIIELFCPLLRKVIIKLPVVHFSVAKPPFIICVKLDLTNGDFERNLKSLNLIEGIDYILLS